MEKPVPIFWDPLHHPTSKHSKWPCCVSRSGLIRARSVPATCAFRRRNFRRSTQHEAIHWIGRRANLQETMFFPIKYQVGSCKLSLEQIQGDMDQIGKRS